jgi:glycosyltransferase involved in cell wall biosynthesis
VLYDIEDDFQRSVRAAAGDEVRFIGPVFEPERVASLRVHSRLYLHGHTVGGTNPSLVEAMAAGNAVVARDNSYNRRMAGRGSRYFCDVDELDLILAELLDDEGARAELAGAARERHAESFTKQQVGSAYEAVLRECLG